MAISLLGSRKRVTNGTKPVFAGLDPANTIDEKYRPAPSGGGGGGGGGGGRIFLARVILRLSRHMSPGFRFFRLKSRVLPGKTTWPCSSQLRQREKRVFRLEPWNSLPLSAPGSSMMNSITTLSPGPARPSASVILSLFSLSRLS